MAGFRETVSIVVDVVTGNAKNEFGKLSDKVGETEGAFNKAKTGAGGLVSAITSSAALSAGAMGAMAATGIKVIGDLVGEYLEAAGAVDDFRVATKLSAEEASRWVNAAKGLGMPVEALQGAFAKLATNIGKNPDLLDDFGLKAARAKNGSVDLPSTLLTITDRMGDLEDPTQQATLGTAAFGKSWQALIPIIDNGSAKVRELAKANGTIFTQKDLDNAEKTEQNMKKIGQGYDKAKAGVAGFIVENAQYVWNDLFGNQEKATEKSEYLASAVGDVGGMYDDMARRSKAASKAQQEDTLAAVAAVQAANDRIKGMSLAMEVPITLTYDAWGEWEKFQKAVAAAASRLPITASAFLIAPGGGTSGADQVAAANAAAARAAEYARRNGR